MNAIGSTKKPTVFAVLKQLKKASPGKEAETVKMKLEEAGAKIEIN